MPWHVAKSSQCGPSKPWAVIKDADGSVAGCHATEESANEQMAALYAKEGTMTNRNAPKPEPPPTGIKVVDAFDRPGASEEVQYRSFAPQLEVRSSDGGRTIFGIAVPYGAPTRIGERLVEQFARGAFDHQIPYPRSVKFARDHIALGGELIGSATMLRDDPAGLYVELRVANTPKGNETLELVKDGALDQLSIAFRERQNRRLSGGVVERLKANLREVAVVLEGAYGELAMAAGVRSRQPYAEPTLDPEAEALNEAVEQYRHGLPSLPDHDVEIRAADLGMSWR